MMLNVTSLNSQECKSVLAELCIVTGLFRHSGIAILCGEFGGDSANPSNLTIKLTNLSMFQSKT